MTIRYKDSRATGYASSFNIHAAAEVLVNFDDGGADSAFIRDLDVLLPGGWKDLRQAFADRDLITDNYNTCFFPPPSDEDRVRGYTL